jgi:hypothetical protein
MSVVGTYGRPLPIIRASQPALTSNDASDNDIGGDPLIMMRYILSIFLRSRFTA